MEKQLLSNTRQCLSLWLGPWPQVMVTRKRKMSVAISSLLKVWQMGWSTAEPPPWERVRRVDWSPPPDAAFGRDP